MGLYMKELNKVELEQVSGAGFVGDILKTVVDVVDRIIDGVAEALHDKNIISESTAKDIEQLTDGAAKLINYTIDKFDL
ncbi:hypothetical protein Xedl_02719 [Xenorhabdus eapokensis]|uniref:Uncharacterized protein n=2 Tax=Xenorhabdus eapokensis TaxID=1873482 RepID=A0A1Q5TNE5_9GAMM|nr:hypothetical protein Xedl_02719 [Xenorhabdus eapokensis]